MKCERCGEKVPKGEKRCADRAACGVRWALKDAATTPGLSLKSTNSAFGVAQTEAYENAPKMGDGA